MKNKITINATKYPDGYLPKIAYHIYRVNRDKVDYFTAKHEAEYGKLTYEDMNKVIDMVVERTKEEDWERRHNPNP